ncbi:hypothetical protein IWX49DRAFT_141885 [Phyllosticta citricarpa]|uniref:Uncharacterized protein n=1 Tax=Phyllosticta citricarpa TaxID=55181 RepID=A0ABR1M7G0_9PEZI
MFTHLLTPHRSESANTPRNRPHHLRFRVLLCTTTTTSHPSRVERLPAIPAQPGSLFVRLACSPVCPNLLPLELTLQLVVQGPKKKASFSGHWLTKLPRLVSCNCAWQVGRTLALDSRIRSMNTGAFFCQSSMESTSARKHRLQSRWEVFTENVGTMIRCLWVYFYPLTFSSVQGLFSPLCTKPTCLRAYPIITHTQLSVAFFRVQS